MVTSSIRASIRLCGAVLGIALVVPVMAPRWAAAGSWQVVAQMEEGRNWPTAVLLQDGTVLLMGGAGSKANRWPLASDPLPAPVVSRAIQPAPVPAGELTRTGS